MSRWRATHTQWLLMLLPVFGFTYWALRPPQTPKSAPAPQPFQLRIIKAEKVPLTALDVSLGADTKIHLEFVATGPPPPTRLNDWEVESDRYLIRDKGGKRVPLKPDLWNRIDGRQVFRGSASWGWANGPDNSTYKMTQLLRLHDMPDSYGALDMRWDVAYGPRVPFVQDESDADKVKRIKQQPFTIGKQITVPLRKANQRIPRVFASTDPLFDVDKIEMTYLPGAQGHNAIRIVIHLFYRGTLPKTKWIDGRSDSGFYKDSLNHSADIFVEPAGVERYYTFHLDESVPDAPSELCGKPQKLTWRARISLNKTWPRLIEVPVIVPFKGKRTIVLRQDKD